MSMAKKIKQILFSMMIAFVLLNGLAGIFHQEFGVITVEAASKIKLNKSKATIKQGATLTLKVVGTDKKVKWSSSDKNIAAVSAKGKVTAKKAGKVTITAKVGGKKYKCVITVKSISETSSNNSYQKYYTKLKTYMQKNGEINSAGNRYIKNTLQYEETWYTFGIIYNKNSNTFEFDIVGQDYNDDSAGFLAMHLKLTYNSKAKLEAGWYADDWAYKSTGTVNLPGYNGKNGISLKVTEKAGTLSDDEANQLTKAYLNLGLTGWNDLLKSRAGITIQNLGFVNFKE